MTNTIFNQYHKISQCTVGTEQTPIFIIDDFSKDPKNLIAIANDHREQYQKQVADFYPGIRKSAPTSYSEQLSSFLLPLFKTRLGASTLSNKSIHSATTKLSTFAITTTAVEKLKPIQMVPHFDSTVDNQYAVIHYLCDKKYGGTSFYRHRETGYERITTAKLTHYGTTLKQQAIAEELHKNPHYISQSTSLFEQLLSIPACMNRVLIYPSNLLHSGDINPVLGLSNEPQQSRLTITSLVVIN